MQKKKKTEDKEKKDGDKKDEDSDKKSSSKDDDKKEKDDDKKKEKKEKKKYRTVNADLLLSCIYFDQNHTGYILDKDLEEIIHSVGLSLSRAQVKKLVTKVTSRESFYYRKLTDQAINEEDSSQEVEKKEIDLEELVKGNSGLLPKSDEGSPGSRKKSAAARSSDEPLTGMIMYNGAMVDIENVLDRLQKGEASLIDYEIKLKELTEEKEQLKKDLKKKEDSYNKAQDNIKSLKQDLSAQEKMTSSCESANKKYLTALITSQSLLNNLVTTVSGALGESSDGRLEKVKKEKDEPNGS